MTTSNGSADQARGEKRVAILSFTPITDEPRVLRQVAALQEDGWEVTLCGFKGRQPPREGVCVVEVDHVMLETPPLKRLRSEFDLLLSRFSASAARSHYWASAGYAGIREHLTVVEPIEADLYVAHDYFTAPIASSLAERHNAAFTVDAHEYARGQYMHDAAWRLFSRPWVHSLQKFYYPKAASITTVCEGIAELIDQEYALAAPTIVVRSAATYRALPFRPTGEAINVLYHGIVSPMRGLEQTIASVPHWRPEFTFQIRGPGPDDYIESLRALAAEHGVQDRVQLLPPVAFDDMVPEANKSDVGFFVQPDLSPQKRFTLPNKLFEYLMAGLAICVADLPEMARVVRTHDAGILVPGLEPEQIAAAINGLNRDEIDVFKKNSLEAARTLNWENESQVMIDNYNDIIAGKGSRPGNQHH